MVSLVRCLLLFIIFEFCSTEIFKLEEYYKIGKDDVNISDKCRTFLSNADQGQFPFWTNRSIFQAWHVGKSIDLWTLDHYNHVTQDLECKLGGSTFQSCNFEALGHDLAENVLIDLCVPWQDCSSGDVEQLSLVIWHTKLNKTNHGEISKIGTKFECVKAFHESVSPGFYIVLTLCILLLVLVVGSSFLLQFE